jgi:hypothetical protein
MLQENAALYQRLVGIRPSRDISRDELSESARRHQEYRANCTTFKPARLRNATKSAGGWSQVSVAGSCEAAGAIATL